MGGFFRSYRIGWQFYQTAFLEILIPKNVAIPTAALFLPQASYVHPTIHFSHFTRYFSSTNGQQISWEGSSSTTLLAKLEIALKNNHADEAWESFLDYKRSQGILHQSLVSRLIVVLSYSSSHIWLQRAYKLVLVILKESPNLLHYDSLSKLALTLVRAQIPVPASTILRIMLEKDKCPSMDVWNTIFFHLTKTEIGSHLASNILIEICEYFLHKDTNAKRPALSKLIEPITTLFNLVLNSCVQFGYILKAQQIIDLMPRIGVFIDANSIIIIARIYEMNGRINDLKNLEELVDSTASSSLHHHYQPFYDCLLSLYFKFNDIDSAANLMLGLYKGGACSGNTTRRELQKPWQVQVGSSNLNMGYKLMARPDQLQNNFLFKAENQSRLLQVKDGKLLPNVKALSKIICGYLRERRMQELSIFLASIHKEISCSEESTLCSDVISAFIQLGWLEKAHDTLDDMESRDIHIDPVLYKSLLRAYCVQNRLDEAKVLEKQMRKANIPVGFCRDEVISSIQNDSSGNTRDSPCQVKKSGFVKVLHTESKEDVWASQLVYDLNSSIFFFCCSKMMEDAMRTFRKMQERKVQATAQTFNYLVSGYSSLEMYREITILWGEIKRRIEEGLLAADRDLFDCLLLNFIRGGYFERVMEIINYMNQHNMFIDKWKYKKEFLKLHRGLYRNLRASDIKTDAQKKRLEHVKAFRRWAGIGVRLYKDLNGL